MVKNPAGSAIPAETNRAADDQAPQVTSGLFFAVNGHLD